MSKLPKEWVESNLLDVVSFKKGKKPKFLLNESNPTTVPYVDIKAFEKKIFTKFTLKEEGVYTDGSDPLMVWDGARSGLVGYGVKGVIGSTISKSSSKVFVSKFHHLYLISLFEQINTNTKGTGIPHVDPAFLKKILSPVPPLAEQKVIAEKLDSLLSQVDRIKKRIDGIPDILKKFRQSVLSDAVSGKLTEDWRGLNEKFERTICMVIGQPDMKPPKGWEWNLLVNLARLESGHTPRKSIPEYWINGDKYWVSLQDIRTAHGTIIKNTKFKPTQLGIDNSSARTLPAGTVCFSRDISVGFTTILGKDMATTQHFANWVTGTELNNKYLMYSFMASKEYLTQNGQGTTVKTIYMPELKQIQLLTPPIKEQKEIVSRVENLFSLADQIENRVKDAQARVDKLTQSVLAKAFSGQLTEEWRRMNQELISGVNSAEALLEKIQVEREMKIK